MNDHKLTKELFDFIKRSPSPFHVIHNAKEMLREAGFTELLEADHWELTAGCGYFVTRNDSSIMAFRLPEKEYRGFHIVASHSDSPTFRIKENGEMTVEQAYVKLNVERYGGMLMAPWFDRPLSIAGRLLVKGEDELQSVLVSVDRDLVLIPNVCIHFNRQINDGYKYNPQVDLLPLYGDFSAKGTLLALVAETAGVPEEDILGSELSLYNRSEPSIWGANEEYMSSPKLDDLQCAYSSLRAMTEAESTDYVNVCAIFDNEEVGSSTKQGAASTFLKDTLKRINLACGKTEEDYYRALADSFMLSADNGHALHPNHPELTDPSNRPVMNGGVLIKHSANQKYTSDAYSAAYVRMLCENAGVPYQEFHNRSDMPGGSTLGNLSGNQVAIPTADIGVAQLAMHSPYETGGVKDTGYLMTMMKTFYN